MKIKTLRAIVHRLKRLGVCPHYIAHRREFANHESGATFVYCKMCGRIIGEGNFKLKQGSTVMTAVDLLDL